MAANWAKQSILANPRFPGGYRTLAACYGNLGRPAEAATAIQKLLALQPGLTIEQLRARLPYFEKAKDLERYLYGLETAGLPRV